MNFALGMLAGPKQAKEAKHLPAPECACPLKLASGAVTEPAK